jgi:hypothetical protein
MVFGSLMPTGGQAESLGGPSLVENILYLLKALADIGSIFFLFPAHSQLTGLQVAWCIAVPVIIIWLIKRSRVLQKVNDAFTIAPLRPLLYVGIAFGVYYTLFFHAPYFITRYLQPLRIFALLTAAMAIGEFVLQIRSSSIAARIAASAFLCSAVAFSGIYYYHVMTGDGNGDLYQAGLWARAHAKSTIGMQQSGITSFVADNVTNLDGKVNADALEAMKKYARGAYIEKQQFDYLMDWDEFARVLVNESEHYGGKYKLVDSVGLVRMYQRIR